MIIFLQNVKKPNITLSPIYKSPILFWHLFIKAQIFQKPNIILASTAQYYFGTYLQKPNNILAPIYKSPNTILTKTITLYLKPKTIHWQKHIFIY